MPASLRPCVSFVSPPCFPSLFGKDFQKRREKTIDNSVVLENLVIAVYHWRLMSWSLVIGRTKLCPEGVFHCRVGGSGAATLAPCPLPQPGAHSEQDRSGWCGAVSPELWEATQKSRSRIQAVPGAHLPSEHLAFPTQGSKRTDRRPPPSRV